MRKYIALFLLFFTSHASFADTYACIEKYEKLFNFGFVSLGNHADIQNVWMKWRLVSNKNNKSKKYEFTVKTLLDEEYSAARLDITLPFFISGMGLMGVYDGEYKQYFRMTNNKPFKRFKGDVYSHRFLGSDILYEDFVKFDPNNINVNCGKEGRFNVITAKVDPKERSSYHSVKLYHIADKMDKVVFYNAAGKANRRVTFAGYQTYKPLNLPFFTKVNVKNLVEGSATELTLLDYKVNTKKISKANFSIRK